MNRLKTASQPLDNKFWVRFAKSYWESKPVVFHKIESDLRQLDDKKVFELLVQASQLCRRERSTRGFKFFVNGIRSSDYETMHVLPKKSDKSLLGYHERMERVYQDYCLVCDELVEISRDQKNPVTRFLRDLFESVGSRYFTELSMYLGNYRKTPFGVHVDRCGVFSFPVIGKKKFRTWSSEYVRQHPDLEQSFRYTKHKTKSKLLIVKPGDMAYWPSPEWHIAESDGKFTATWSLGVWMKRPPKRKKV